LLSEVKGRHNPVFCNANRVVYATLGITAIARMPNVFNTKNYGGVGDGLTLDTAAINKAKETRPLQNAPFTLRGVGSPSRRPNLSVRVPLNLEPLTLGIN